MDTYKVIGDLRKQIEPYSQLDDGDEYGEYVGWLLEVGNRWDMMSKGMLEAYITELQEVLGQYTANYEIAEVEETRTTKIQELRYKG